MAYCVGFILKLVALAFLCKMVNLPQHGEAGEDCNSVAKELVPCYPYIFRQEVHIPVEQCCKNVQKLVDIANDGTRADRQSFCNCLKRIGSGMKDEQIEKANTLPLSCKRSIPYTLSDNMDCWRMR